uniref:Integrin beta n=1 Tax=Halocynthia roretzi TaxID=7729 RepID=Q75S84_HALRO|nr:integrin beta Hr2 precursor [Halocynthia roretzi]
MSHGFQFFRFIDAIRAVCKENQADCKTCILANPECSWCSKIDSQTTTSPLTERCRYHMDQLQQCKGATDNPTSSSTIVKNIPFTDAGPDFFDNETNVGSTVIQMRPQEFNLKLRPNVPEVITVTLRKVIDYPLDIYYVMDLSNSMADDLVILQNLGTRLFSNIRDNVTKNVQLGFGSFVDKVKMPFTSTVPSQLRNPCAQQNASVCAPPFGFRHQVNITSNQETFAQAIQNTTISGNIDSPEGSLDALMQIAVCSHINWREGATHVILLTTDATPHLALDGKLAAILESNDMKCHMELGANPYLPDALVYARSKTMDYPSLGQLRKVFDDNKIQSIYAVTREVFSLYQDIPNVINNAFVAELSNDSSNIIPLIASTYNDIRGRLVLTPPTVPSNVQLTYRVFCKNNTAPVTTLECTNVEIGDEVRFEFTFTATSCPATDRIDPVLLRSSSVQDEVRFNLGYVCDCNCTNNVTVNSTLCSYQGNLTCAKCVCEPGREGSMCQCLSADVVKGNCARPGSSKGDCEGNGICECGECVCNGGNFGSHCQCQSTGCAVSNNQLCGGPERGECRNCDGNNECVCKNGYSVRPSDLTCACHNDTCKQNQSTSVICNDRGQCECDTCDCSNKQLYNGAFCQTCIHPDCTSIDATCTGQLIRQCAECYNKQDRDQNPATDECKRFCGNEFLTTQFVTTFYKCDSCNSFSTSTECNQCSRHSTNGEPFTPVQCLAKQADTECDYNYEIVWLTTYRFQIYVKRYNKENDCPRPPDPLVIALPVVGAVVLIGIIALIIWKVIQTLRDKREYEKFKKEEDLRKWTKGENPVYVNASSKFDNPMFGGNKDD